MSSRLRTSLRAEMWESVGSEVAGVGTEGIERGQAAGKQLAEDDALGNAVGEPEAGHFRQLLEPALDVAPVAAGQRRLAVAHHHPVGLPVIDQAPLAQRLGDQLGVVAGPEHLQRVGIDAAEDVEIDDSYR